MGFMTSRSGSNAAIVSDAPADSGPVQFSHKIGDVLGLACLIASLLLISTGVRTVRADGEALMSVDPKLAEAVEAEEQQAVAKADVPARPIPGIAPADQQPGVPGVEVQPGVVVLNTRGFNYGSAPAAIDPAAMRVEK